MQLLEKRAEPQRRRHDIIRHAHAFAAQVGETLNSRCAVYKETEPDEGLGGKYWQGAPLPSCSIASLSTDRQLGQRHLESVELVVFEIAIKKLRWRGDDKMQIQSLR